MQHGIFVRKFINAYHYMADTLKFKSQCFMERRECRKTGGNYALMFHCVSNERKDWDDEEFSITSDSFKILINILLEKKVFFCTPEQFLEKKGSGKILLTFDDAYEGVYSDIYPFLKEKQIPFVVFQTVDFLDRKKYLSVKMINEMLLYDRFFLGTHTISHCNLHESKEAKKEIQKPIEVFIKEFDIQPMLFAYPYGAYVTIDAWHVKWVAEKYRCAFSTCNMEYGKYHSRYLIPRVNINENNYMTFLEKKVGD